MIALIVGRNEQERNAYQWFIREWQEALTELALDSKIQVYPEIQNPDEITSLLVWNPPIGVFKQFRNLKGIFSLAAGVDHILVDPDIDTTIPIMRVVDPYMANDIVQYVTAYVLHFIKRIDHWDAMQKQKTWFKQPPFNYADKTIGIMGLGFLGKQAALILKQLQLNVIGYSKSKKNLPDIETYDASSFDDFLAKSDILICMLPLTAETKGILNYKTFSKLPKGAHLINLGRGQHLIESDLLLALDQGILSGACLDVFIEEPLPSTHAFWAHPSIRVTPHIASVTNAKTAAIQIFENYQRLQKGETLLNCINIEKGY